LDFTTSIGTCFSKYATLSGRASRSEYWFFSLFYVIGLVTIYVASLVLGALLLGSPFTLVWGGIGLLGLLGALGAGGVLAFLFGLVMLIPHWAVSVRRLHDSDKSGWWLLLGLVPVVGGLIVMILMLLPGTPGPNRYGSAEFL
jgi:uncharacterized membrane protein YhaH (DUF805 family)